MWARVFRNFAQMTTSTPFRDLLHVVNLRHGTDGFTSPPKEGVLRIFSPWNLLEVVTSKSVKEFWGCNGNKHWFGLLSGYSPGRWGEIWGSRIVIKITVFLEVTPCSLVARYQSTRHNEQQVVLTNWGCVKRGAEENMSIWGRGGDRGGRETHIAIAELRPVRDGGIYLTCTVHALYVWVPRAAGLANWS